MHNVIEIFNAFNVLNDEWIKPLISGTALTFSLTILALIMGFCLAIILTYALYTQTMFKALAKGFIFFTRSVPLLVQIFLLYYGSAQFEWLRNSVLWEILQYPFSCALIALALNSSAYTAVLLQQNINCIPKGEIEACILLNMSLYTRMRKILLPRVLSTFWPVYSNEAMMVLKSTSLVSTITLMDLMGVTRQIIAKTFQWDVLIITGILYFLMSALLVGFFNQLCHNVRNDGTSKRFFSNDCSSCN